MKRPILHISQHHRGFAVEYVNFWKRTVCNFPHRLNKDGQGEFYYRLIIARLQNRSYRDIGESEGCSKDRVRQVYSNFQRFCNKRGYLINRPLAKKLVIAE
jgi:hypothetical protein